MCLTRFKVAVMGHRQEKRGKNRNIDSGLGLCVCVLGRGGGELE